MALGDEPGAKKSAYTLLEGELMLGDGPVRYWEICLNGAGSSVNMCWEKSRYVLGD